MDVELSSERKDHPAAAGDLPLQKPRPASRVDGIVMRLRCAKCGKTVSSEVPDGTIIRAWLECPECVASSPEHAALEKIANTEMPPADNSLEVTWQGRMYSLRSIAREAIGMDDA